MSIHITLRDYQRDAIQQVKTAWDNGVKNVGLVLPTGAGKTVIFSHFLREEKGGAVVLAHRRELIYQVSLMLAKIGVKHDILARDCTVKSIAKAHRVQYGRTFYDPTARVMVASVSTLLYQGDDPRFKQVKLVVVDEAHHALKHNSWGRAVLRFPNARGLYPTATPLRGDRKSLCNTKEGLIDTLIATVSMRELINRGYLADYRIYAPTNNLDLSRVNITASGDYNPQKMATAVKESTITGDVVTHYLRLAKGQKGITFAASIGTANDILTRYREAGVPAELLTAKTDPAYRAKVMRDFRTGEILQLVNVDILGEGVDVPDVQVVSFARPTQSYGLYVQQFGRALRPAPGKTHALIIDHVGNVLRHGVPDARRVWTLDTPDRTSRKTDAPTVTIRVCDNPACNAVYERYKYVCPYCGHRVVPAMRSTPEEVEGDLHELDEQALAYLRGEIARIDSPVRYPFGVSSIAKINIANHHEARQTAQKSLRDQIAQWAGCRRAEGLDDREIHRLFFSTYQIDILTAQTLNAAEAKKLKDEIIFY